PLLSPLFLHDALPIPPGKAAAGLTLPAEVRPLVDAPIYARSSGYLKQWLVDIGGHVNEGDLLAEIDAPELRQELARAKAERLQSDRKSTRLNSSHEWT